jgi:hypothetical protein
MACGHVDLSAGEAMFEIPPVPVWQESDIDMSEQFRTGARALAAFHGPGCSCGRPFGIGYDLRAIVASEHDPNEVLLHELTHAWQFHIDPGGSDARHVEDVAEYGYWDAPHEVEARLIASVFNVAGIRVWFPSS